MNRRQLLLGAVFATSLGPFAEARRFGGVGGGGSFALVAPSGSWTGTPGSGGTAPTDPTRTTAKPAAQWWQPSQLRGVGNTLIGVIADAKGGISKVRFWVEGTTQDVTSLVYVADTDINGNARIRPMWGVNVDCAAAYAAHPTGAVRIYATAYPNDGTMQVRTIGPLLIYPRAAAYDWQVTVDPSGSNTGSASASGGNYLTLAAAMQGMQDALKLNGFQCGKVTISRNGTYSWGWPSDQGYPWSQGYSCVTTAPGVSATIARFNNAGVNAFSPSRSPSDGSANDPWYMFAYVNNLEFRGNGLTIDRQNIRYISSWLAQYGPGYTQAQNLNPMDGSNLSSGSFYFNGCNVTNTYGSISTAPYQLYWNDSIPPAIQIGDPFGNYVVAFGDGVTCTHLVGGPVFLNSGLGGGAIFSRCNDSLGVQHQAPHMTFGEYTTNSPLSTGLYLDGISPPQVGGSNVGNPAVTIRYVGSGGTDATIAFDGSDHFVMDVTSGGVSIAGYPVTFAPIDPTQYPANMTASPPQPVRWADIASWLTTNRPGDWTFSYPAQTFTPFWSRIGNVGSGLQPWPQHVKSAAYTVLASAQFHDELTMWNGPYENVIFWNNVCTNSGFSTTWLNVHDAGDKDFSIKNNSFDHGTSDHNLGNSLAPLGSHMLVENNTAYEHYTHFASSLDAYSSVAQNVFALIDNSGGYVGNAIPTNCLAGGTMPSGTGCISLAAGTPTYATTWSALFVNNAAGNFTPAGGGTLATNLFTPANPRDAQMATRGATDAAGAWKLGGSAPIWPF